MEVILTAGDPKEKKSYDFLEVILTVIWYFVINILRERIYRLWEKIW